MPIATTSTVFGVGLTLASVTLGKLGLISKAGHSRRPLADDVSCPVLCHYLKSKRWMLGSVLTLVSGLLMLWTLKVTPLAIVTPLAQVRRLGRAGALDAQ